MSIHLSRRLSRRLVAGTALSAGLLVAIGASSASAHVGTDKSEIVAGASTTVTFAIGHGCDDSPTNSMKFQIPESVVNAAPQVKPGWTITTESEALTTPIESAHGDPQTDRVSVITFTADDGNATDPHYRDTFTLAFRAPEELGVLPFKVIQGCETGENAWVEEWDGTGEEPESPAPSVDVVAAPAGAGEQTAGATETSVAATDTTVEVSASVPASTSGNNGVASDSDSDSDDGGSDGLAITGIVVGGLGLVVGGTALARSRRPGA